MSEHHVLVVAFDGDEIDVEHPDCRVELDEIYGGEIPIATRPDCPVDFEVGNVGFDSLRDEFDVWPPPDGRYPIEFWHDTYPGGPWGAEEHDTGLRRVEIEPR